MNQKDVAAWVRQAREAKGWTQQQLADAMGLTKANVSHWETCKHDPSFLQLLKIRDLTGWPLRDVLNAEQWPFPRVGRERVASLDPDQLASLETGLIMALAAITARQATEPERRKQA